MAFIFSDILRITVFNLSTRSLPIYRRRAITTLPAREQAVCNVIMFIYDLLKFVNIELPSPCFTNHGLSPRFTNHGLSPCFTNHGLSPCFTNHGLSESVFCKSWTQSAFSQFSPVQSVFYNATQGLHFLFVKCCHIVNKTH